MGMCTEVEAYDRIQGQWCTGAQLQGLAVGIHADSGQRSESGPDPGPHAAVGICDMEVSCSDLSWHLAGT